MQVKLPFLMLKIVVCVEKMKQTTFSRKKTYYKNLSSWNLSESAWLSRRNVSLVFDGQVAAFRMTGVTVSDLIRLEVLLPV